MKALKIVVIGLLLPLWVFPAFAVLLPENRIDAKSSSASFYSLPMSAEELQRQTLLRTSTNPTVVLDNIRPVELARLFGQVRPKRYVFAIPPEHNITNAKVRIDIFLSGRGNSLNNAQFLRVRSPEGTFTDVVSGGTGRTSDLLKGVCHTVNDMFENAWSEKYQSWMPCATFFQGRTEEGTDNVYGVHGTEAVDKLGTPASHGCIRTNTETACRIQQVIDTYSSDQTVICVH
jgi:hypothetical protein